MIYEKRPCNAYDCDNWITRPELCQKCMDTIFNIELNCSMIRINLFQYLLDNNYKLPIKWREMSINALKDDMISFISNKEIKDMLNVYNSKRMLNIILRFAKNTEKESIIIKFNNENKVTCIPANQPSRSKIKKYQ